MRKESESRHERLEIVAAKLQDDSQPKSSRIEIVHDLAEIRLPQSRDLLASLIEDQSEEAMVRSQAVASLADFDPERTLAKAYALVDEIDPNDLKYAPNLDPKEEERLDSLAHLRLLAISMIGELEGPAVALAFLKNLDRRRNRN